MTHLPLVCIEDFLIDSNHYGVDIAADTAPARWFGDHAILVPSFHDIGPAIASGHFDLS